MPGIAGGFNVNSKAMATHLCYRNYTRTDTISSDIAEFTVAHHEPANNSDWSEIRGENIMAVVWGQAPPSMNASLINKALHDVSCLKGLDGSWALAAMSGHKVILATDRMASRPVYYSDQSPIRVSSEIKGILSTMKNWSLDISWLMDFLTFGFGWGNSTIVKEIKSLPPATAMVADENSYEIRRYADWIFSADAKPQDYVPELVLRYKDAVEYGLSRLPQSLSVGFDLSGGLDSRVMASVARNRINSTFTYDDNPPSGRNPVIAAEIAKVLDMPNLDVGYGEQDAWAKILEDAIWATDSMKEWIHYHGVTTIWASRQQQVDVMISASGQGELFGEDISEELLAMSPVAALLRRFQNLDPGIVKAIITNKGWSPENSIQSAIESTIGRTDRDRILCGVYDNFYPNFHFRGKPARAVIEIANLLINCSLINWIGAMPASLRDNRLLKGRLPGCYSTLKLEMACLIDHGIENVPCERSYFPPKSPALLHAISCIFQGLMRRFRRNKTISKPKAWMCGPGEFQSVIKMGLSSLSAVHEINMDQIWAYWASYQLGQKDFTPLFSRLSTVGLWLQRANDKFPSH